MAGILSLAHITDTHLAPVPWPARGEWRLKRALGLANWHRLRRRQHLPELLAGIVTDVAAATPDHIAVTGDLVNIGLAAEHAAAADWLAQLGPPDRVTAVPGNHDILVDMAIEQGIGRWQAYMTGETEAASRPSFPFVRRLGHVALIGVNSAVPTPPFRASGRLGAEQISRLEVALERLGADGLVRVVLIHHPPLPGQAPARCGLEDAGALAAVLARRGAELVIHGHNHRAMLAFAKGPRRPIPVVGAASASLGQAHGRQTLARYNLYRLAADPEAPIERIERGIGQAGAPVVELGRDMLVPRSGSVT